MKLFRTLLDAVMLVACGYLVLSFGISAASGEVAQLISTWVPYYQENPIDPVYLQGIAVICIGAGIFSHLIKSSAAASPSQWVE